MAGPVGTFGGKSTGTCPLADTAFTQPPPESCAEFPGLGVLVTSCAEEMGLRDHKDKHCRERAWTQKR